MVRACLDAGAHYLDITGEIDVFERIMAMDAEAKARGVTLLPGVGFDVVPTDCLAAMLSGALPDADDLMLAFHGGAGLSAGTSKTIVEGIDKGGAVRIAGRITKVPTVYDIREIPFPGGTRLGMTIPWGDVATAYYTTGIPNIRVYRATSRRAVANLRRIQPFLPLLRLPTLKFLLRRRAARQKGPDAAARDRAQMEIWGRVANAAGRSVVMTMRTPEAYALTVESAIAAVNRILSERVRAGSFTPALRFGPDFVTTLTGVTVSI
jgi:short subunit dehydrogenase-like uncharacterized protein